MDDKMPQLPFSYHLSVSGQKKTSQLDPRHKFCHNTDHRLSIPSQSATNSSSVSLDDDGEPMTRGFGPSSVLCSHVDTWCEQQHKEHNNYRFYSLSGKTRSVEYPRFLQMKRFSLQPIKHTHCHPKQCRIMLGQEVNPVKTYVSQYQPRFCRAKNKLGRVSVATDRTDDLLEEIRSLKYFLKVTNVDVFGCTTAKYTNRPNHITGCFCNYCQVQRMKTPHNAGDFDRNRDMLFSEESRCTLSSESQLRSYGSSLMSRLDSRGLLERSTTLSGLLRSGGHGAGGRGFDVGMGGEVKYVNYPTALEKGRSREHLTPVLKRSSTIAEVPQTSLDRSNSLTFWLKQKVCIKRSFSENTNRYYDLSVQRRFLIDDVSDIVAMDPTEEVEEDKEDRMNEMVPLSKYRPPLSRQISDMNMKPQQPGRAKRSMSLFEMSDTKPREYEQLNNYILKETIGQGSYGTVRICTDQNTQIEYAIKIISKKRIKSKAGFSGKRQLQRGSPRAPPGRQALGGGNNPLAGIQREIAILKKCDHENIVRLKEVIDDNESPEQNIYLVFELMNRGPVMEEPNMSNREQVDPLSESECRIFFRDLLLGLEYLHYQKIVHRDIKPSNLLLSSDNHLKIADFGVSEIFEGDRAILKNSAGSPAFLPPEAVDPNVKIFDGQLLDIWACGVTLYIFAFGRCPFVGKSILELHENIRSKALSFPDMPNATEPLKDLLNQVLCKNPLERMSVSAAKSHTWTTNTGTEPLISTEENCDLVHVTDAEVANAVTCIKWGTMLVLYNIARHRSFKLRSDSRRPPGNVADSMDDLKLQEPQNT